MNACIACPKAVLFLWLLLYLQYALPSTGGVPSLLAQVPRRGRHLWWLHCHSTDVRRLWWLHCQETIHCHGSLWWDPLCGDTVPLHPLGACYQLVNLILDSVVDWIVHVMNAIILWSFAELFNNCNKLVSMLVYLALLVQRASKNRIRSIYLPVLSVCTKLYLTEW